jgi:lactoylglutathione lyase
LREYYIDENLVDPRPRWIGVFDDVLTVGTHFVAMKRVLSARPRLADQRGTAGPSYWQGFQMSRDDFPEPQTGFVVTHFLVVSDQDRSRDYYQSVFGAELVQERDPVILKLANSWLTLNVGGGPTDDKPAVTLTNPQDPDQTSAFINLRVADIAAAYAQWSARGAHFLTEPKQRRTEIRAYIRDPDGHLIEVGQTTARMNSQ